MTRYASSASSDRRPKKKSKTVPVLLSCCLFLVIICGCLIAALVLIGRHILYNSPQPLRKATVVKPLPVPVVPAVAVVAVVAAPPALPQPEPQPEIFQLPRDVTPVLYDLTLRPNLETGHYDGLVNITLNVTRASKNIMLHSTNLTIDTVELTGPDWKVVQIANVNESSNEFIKIKLNQIMLPDNVYNLYIKFQGNMLNKYRGFYRSTYKTKANETRNIATSKFEPTYARQAFPCFDEPNMKAIFKVHLLKPVDGDYIALSNFPAMPGTTTTDGGEMVEFLSTNIRMSTYLVCFIVSDFKHTKYTFNNKGSIVPFNVYASPDQLEKTKYAGDVGKKVMEYYVQYFNIPYPLPKLDMVAIPDFVSGAMEHWGLVTYRETALLYTDNTHSSANKQRVATVVAHELAHSWFGNLVTMDWWNNLWLNEGFASYIEYKGVMAAEPTWGMFDQFLTAELHPVLALDATLSSHPVIVTVETPDQITEVFDTISYNKGASILRMLETAVSAEKFQEGVTNYLNKHAFGNAVSNDFWTEIQNVLDDKQLPVTVKEFMDTFTVQMGYPVLDVQIEGENYVLTQKRFLKDPEANTKPEESPYQFKWTLPITYRTSEATSPEVVWFKHDENSVSIPKPIDAKWVKFNNDQIGYYRVNYPVEEWHKLVEAYPSLSISDRTHLLEESFSLAEAGLLNYEIPLSLTKKLSAEKDYVPWSVAASKFSAIKSYLGPDAIKYLIYVKTIVSPAYERFSWTETSLDSQLTRLARVVVLNLACSVGHEMCTLEVSRKFRDWIADPTIMLSQDLRSLIYKYGMKSVSAENWDKMFEIFAAETDANEKLKLMNGLASTENKGILEKLLDLGSDKYEHVRSQDYFTLLQYISANTQGTELIWDFVRSDWEKLVERFTLNDRYLGTLIPAITGTFSTEEKLNEMKDFFAKYPEAGAGATSRLRALENVQNNINWLSKHKDIVESWIAANPATS